MHARLCKTVFRIEPIAQCYELCSWDADENVVVNLGILGRRKRNDVLGS